MDVSSLNLALPAAGDTVPEWVHVMPAGTFKGVTGEQTYHLKDPQAVIAASMTAGKLPLDENHSTQRAPETGSASPARAWIMELQSRPDGIWGRPDWNKSGVALMTDRAYRNLSPVFEYAPDGSVLRILSVALTNNPNLAQLVAMHTAQTSGDYMDKKTICTALGIAETVDDTGVMTALMTAVQARTALAVATGEVAKLTAELAAVQKTAVPVTEFLALQTKLSSIEDERKLDKATAFVDGAIKAGKPIASIRENIIAMHTADAAGTEAMVNKMVSINAGGTQGRMPPKGATGTALMTAEDMAVCTKMGLDPEKYAETKTKMTEGSAV